MTPHLTRVKATVLTSACQGFGHLCPAVPLPSSLPVVLITHFVPIPRKHQTVSFFWLCTRLLLCTGDPVSRPSFLINLHSSLFHQLQLSIQSRFHREFPPKHLSKTAICSPHTPVKHKSQEGRTLSVLLIAITQRFSTVAGTQWVLNGYVLNE